MRTAKTQHGEMSQKQLTRKPRQALVGRRAFSGSFLVAAVPRCVSGALWFYLILLVPTVHQAEVIDRLMAVVDRQIITLGDIEQELKLQEMDPHPAEPGRPAENQEPRQTEQLVLDRLIEQNLIRQQIGLFPGIDVTEEEIETQMAEMQKKFGGATAWNRALKEHGVTLESIRNRIRWQLEVMKFIDYRFRQFVIIDAGEIEAYYNNQFLRDLRQRGIREQPPLSEVEEKIRQILVEDKLNAQVDEWLSSLRAAAAIEIFH
jgi:peptidyl-prolyl cis-trans isomerase SurA